MTDGVDEARWLEIYRETIGPLYAFVARRCGGGREVAEDVTQETWLRAVDAWPRRGPPREPLAWLQTTARRLLIDWARNEARRRIAGDEVASDGVDHDEVETRPFVIDDRSWTSAPRHAVAAVQQALAKLRSADAALLERFHFDGRSVRELATECNASERAIEGRLRRAREALAAILQPWFEEGSKP